MKLNNEPSPDHAKRPKPKRSRKGVPKSKTGCITCRIRRLKCDETKPACTRCATTQRACNYLDSSHIQPQPPPKPRTKIKSSSQDALLHPKLAPAPFGPFTLEEGPNFSFFLTICTRSLSRHFGDPLWTYLVFKWHNLNLPFATRSSPWLY
ncbi:hypothetical protein V8E51_004189 [Hyaloscypha variabilis]